MPGLLLWEASNHLERLEDKTDQFGTNSKGFEALSLFLLPKNFVPVVFVGFGYRLLTLAHALLF